MAVSGLNNYLYTLGTDAGNNAAQTRGKSELGMSDFMNLLVAQMTNQDMNDPVSNTEFIAQMAQFSALQGIQTLQEYSLSSYAVSYTGKNVVIAHQNELTGALEEIRGLVEGVSFYSGSPMVYVNGKGYQLYEIMEVTAAPLPSESGTTDGTEETTDPEVSFYRDDENFDYEAYLNSDEYDPDFPDGLIRE